METFSSFNAIIQNAIIKNWDQDALTDYQGITLQFHDVARKIEKIHILFENSGVVKGVTQPTGPSLFWLHLPMEQLLYLFCMSSMANRFRISSIIQSQSCFSSVTML